MELFRNLFKISTGQSSEEDTNNMRKEDDHESTGSHASTASSKSLEDINVDPVKDGILTRTTKLEAMTTNRPELFQNGSFVFVPHTSHQISLPLDSSDIHNSAIQNFDKKSERVLQQMKKTNGKKNGGKQRNNFVKRKIEEAKILKAQVEYLKNELQQRQNHQGYFDPRGTWPYSQNRSWMNRPLPRMNYHLPPSNSIDRSQLYLVRYGQAAPQPTNIGFNGGCNPYQPTGLLQSIETGVYTKERPSNYEYQIPMRNYSSSASNNGAYRYN